MKNKETLEEAAKYYAHNYFEMHDTNNYKALKQGFEAGAKWQQEQEKNKYSEQDMKRAFNVGFQVGYNDETSPSYLTAENFIEQFKKK
jgi:hypothetical protein